VEALDDDGGFDAATIRAVATDRLAIGGVLVVGGGYAGSIAARKLGECTIVNPENYMLFRPLLAEAASGAIEPRHVVVPLRVMCPRAELIVGSAVSVDLDARSVTVRTEGDTYAVRYWNLVIALGAGTRVLPVPGLAEHAMGFNDLADAITLRNHVLRELEAADAEIDPRRRDRHLGFVFVGAGYAGTEGLAELNDLARSALRYYPRLREAPQRWVLVEAQDRILPEVRPSLADYTARLLERRGVEIKTRTRLESVDAEVAVLSDGTRVDTHTLVWTAGVRPNPLLEQWGLPLDERGRVEVDEFLRVRGYTDVWAVGDCARVPNQASGEPDPPTSQHALRQARALARNLRGRPRPYTYRMIGQGATLGLYKGIAEIFGLRLRGFIGWWATRTYHLYQLPLLSRKLRVLADWTIALLFRRDIAELGSLGHPRRLEP
jgi:NADH dehydrogenase